MSAQSPRLEPVPPASCRHFFCPDPRRFAQKAQLLSQPPRQCLSRRIPDKESLTKQVAAWQIARNSKHASADWHFTTADARIKLKRQRYE